ncbi:MAG: hypothetical protein QW754_06135 [Thermoplasmata archaeon]
MVQISNNLLVVLLLVAIIISGMGILTILTLPIQVPRMAGAATGVTNLSIQSLASIRLIRNVSDFGSGNPTPGQILHLYSNSTNLNGFNNGSEGNGTDYGEGTHVYPFVVENDGNDDTTCVKISSNKDANGFIGGSNPSGPIFQFVAINNETNSCANGLQTSWTDVTTSEAVVCEELHTESGGSGSNTIRIHWHLGIPSDAQGQKTAVITVSGYSNC